jgi:hypothetical protein
MNVENKHSWARPDILRLGQQVLAWEMSMKIKTVHIKKTGEDSYTCTIPDDHVEEEDLTSAQLLGMLDGKKFVGTDADSVLGRLDSADIGTEMTVQFEPLL